MQVGVFLSAIKWSGVWMYFMIVGANPKLWHPHRLLNRPKVQKRQKFIVTQSDTHDHSFHQGRHGVWLPCKDLPTPEISPWHACVLQAWQRGDSKALFVTKEA